MTTCQTHQIVAELIGDLPKLCTRAEAAKALRRNDRSIDRWIAKGLLRAIRPAGGHPLIPRTEIERLLVEGGRREKGRAPCPVE